MPDNLRSQIPMIFDFFDSALIPVLIQEGYEADDIIGSIVKDPDGYAEVVIILNTGSLASLGMTA